MQSIKNQNACSTETLDTTYHMIGIVVIAVEVKVVEDCHGCYENTNTDHSGDDNQPCVTHGVSSPPSCF